MKKINLSAEREKDIGGGGLFFSADNEGSSYADEL